MILTLNEIRDILTKASLVIQEYTKLQSLPNCSTCKKAECEYRPQGNEYMRINCPLFEGDKEP